MTLNSAPRAARRPTPAESSLAVGDDRELVTSVLRGDRKAAARLIGTHADAVYAYVHHRLAPRSDLVDDVVQDVFLAALNSLATFQGTSSLRTWFIGIARHKIADLYRQRLCATELDIETVETTAAEDEPPDELLEAARTRTKAREVLARLPERYALLLLWRYWEQRSTREIAIAIGTTEKSVERALARARTYFKKLWMRE